MECPNCKKNNTQMINEVESKGKNFSATKGCLGTILLGPIGLLCGSCGKGKQIKSQNYWVCNDCGHKWKA